MRITGKESLELEDTTKNGKEEDIGNTCMVFDKLESNTKTIAALTE